MISLTRPLALTAIVAFVGAGSIPTASACDGDACASFTIVGKRITNKDHKNKIHLIGCVHAEINAPLVGTICSIDGKFDVTVDPDKTKDIEGKVQGNVRIDVTRALLIKR